MSEHHKPKAQREHALIYSKLSALQREFRASQMPVEEALAMLCIRLLALEYAERHRPGNIDAALKASAHARKRLIKRIDAEQR